MFSFKHEAFSDSDNTIVISTVVHVADHTESVLEPVTGTQQTALLANLALAQSAAGATNFLQADPHDVTAFYSGGSMYVVESVADDYGTAPGNAPVELVGVHGIVTSTYIG